MDNWDACLDGNRLFGEEVELFRDCSVADIISHHSFFVILFRTISFLFPFLVIIFID